MRNIIRVVHFFIVGISEAFELYFGTGYENKDYKFINNTFRYHKM